MAPQELPQLGRIVAPACRSRSRRSGRRASRSSMSASIVAGSAHRRFHQRGVERAGHVEPDRPDLPLLRERLGALDRRDAAADHDLRGGVLVRDQQDVVLARFVAERLRGLGVGAEQRASSCRVGLRRRAASPRPRTTTRRSASGSEHRPAATSAANSPSEWPAAPATRSERGPRPPTPGTRPPRTPAGPAARTRWWPGHLVVAAGDDVAPHRLGCLFETAWPAGCVVHGSAMPSNWDPCPGNTTANVTNPPRIPA